jgi:hypothetical protein
LPSQETRAHSSNIKIEAQLKKDRVWKEKIMRAKNPEKTIEKENIMKVKTRFAPFIATNRRGTMREKSRNWKAKFGPALVMALVACSVTWAQDVRTNYMPGTDFSKYHTYAWADEVMGVPRVGGQPDQILDTQVKQAVDSQMAAKGFTKVVDDEKPDLILGYQLAIDREKQINGFADGWGGWGGPWGGGLNSFSASTSTINVGTFVLGIYDPSAKKLIWIGAAQHTIEPSKNQEKNEKRLNKGAQKLLKDFPPGRK